MVINDRKWAHIDYRNKFKILNAPKTEIWKHFVKFIEENDPCSTDQGEWIIEMLEYNQYTKTEKYEFLEEYMTLEIMAEIVHIRVKLHFDNKGFKTQLRSTFTNNIIRAFDSFDSTCLHHPRVIGCGFAEGIWDDIVRCSDFDYDTRKMVTILNRVKEQVLSMLLSWYVTMGGLLEDIEFED